MTDLARKADFIKGGLGGLFTGGAAETAGTGSPDLVSSVFEDRVAANDNAPVRRRGFGRRGERSLVAA